MNVLYVASAIAVGCVAAMLGGCRDRQAAGDNGRAECERPYTYRNDDGEECRISLRHVSDSLTYLEHAVGGVVVSRWVLRYPTYRLTCGDITGDGVPDIGVGVIKPTQFYPDTAKRLFLFKLIEGREIGRLCMISRVGSPLEDFWFEGDEPPMVVHTVENDKRSGRKVERLYEQKGFGLRYIRSLGEEMHREEEADEEQED